MSTAADTALPRAESADEIALRRRGVTLGLLTVTYFFSYMDRQILSILLEDIKADLVLTDTQLGLVGGFAFALFYATLGVPVARLADRGNRRDIIVWALAIWSAMTAVCGLAQNFLHLLLARIGVGIGEAGSSPPSHSMIADLYAPNERASAMAIYALGVVLGGGFGTIIGGTIAHYYDWRTAFFAVGIPGVLLAFVVRAFIVEPRRGLADPAHVPAAATEMPSLREGFTLLWSNPAARNLVMGVTLTSLIGYGLAIFHSPFHIRSFGMTKLEIAWYLAPLVAVAGVASGIIGGKICDRVAGRKGLHTQSWLVAAFKTIAFPFMLAHYLIPDVTLALAAYIIGVFFQASYLGPTFSLIQGLAPMKVRALWSALTLLIINLIGLGAGPFLVGAVSDLYKPMFGNESLRYALLTMAAATPWAIWHYWRAGIHLKQAKLA